MKKNHRVGNLYAGMSVLLLALTSQVSSAAIVTFDSLETPGNSFELLPTPLTVEGFVFTTVSGNGSPVLATIEQGSTQYNGSAALTSSNSSDIEMTLQGGGLFSIGSLDVDNIFQTVSGGTFEFIGNLSGGGQVAQQFAADNSLGNETVSLIGFQNLTSLILGGAGTLGFANIGTVDNINTSLNPVPVPAAVWLFGTGLIGLFGFSKRKKAALQSDS